MVEFLKFVFSNFWSWLGFIIVFITALNFIIKLINLPFKHRRIIKLGYPPEHCDADGNTYEKKED